ncbi:hypothetical protein EMCRGX_G018301 [Ephydatia muelleri]
MASSWLKKWREETNSDRKTCCVIGCSSEDLVGGHVIIVDKRSDNSWWIAPICRKCNHFSNETEMFIDSRVTLVATCTMSHPFFPISLTWSCVLQTLYPDVTYKYYINQTILTALNTAFTFTDSVISQLVTGCDDNESLISLCDPGWLEPAGQMYSTNDDWRTDSVGLVSDSVSAIGASWTLMGWEGVTLAAGLLLLQLSFPFAKHRLRPNASLENWVCHPEKSWDPPLAVSKPFVSSPVLSSSGSNSVVSLSVNKSYTLISSLPQPAATFPWLLAGNLSPLPTLLFQRRCNRLLSSRPIMSCADTRNDCFRVCTNRSAKPFVAG